MLFRSWKLLGVRFFVLETPSGIRLNQVPWSSITGADQGLPCNCWKQWKLEELMESVHEQTPLEQWFGQSDLQLDANDCEDRSGPSILQFSSGEMLSKVGRVDSESNDPESS